MIVVSRGAPTPTDSPVKKEPKHMVQYIEVRRTYKYQLYQNKRNKHLVNAIDIAINILQVGASTHSLEVVRREEGDTPDFRSLA